MNHAERYARQVADLWETSDTTLPQGRVWRGFLALAKGFTAVDWDRSRTLAIRHRTAPRMCFQNCARVAVRTDLEYWEGFATSVVPVEHAWLVDPATGMVLDPTWVHGDRRPEAADYYGVRVPLADLRQPRNPWEPGWLSTVLAFLDQG